MNKLNETIVSGETMQHLREAGVSSGYEPVPRELQNKANELLGQFRHSVANMDEDFKRRLRNFNKRKRREGVRGY